jgi:hypothetical protein
MNWVGLLWRLFRDQVSNASDSEMAWKGCCECSGYRRLDAKGTITGEYPPVVRPAR